MVTIRYSAGEVGLFYFCPARNEIPFPEIPYTSKTKYLLHIHSCRCFLTGCKTARKLQHCSWLAAPTTQDKHMHRHRMQRPPHYQVLCFCSPTQLTFSQKGKLNHPIQLQCLLLNPPLRDL